jgi:hypothetical protein
MTQQSESVQGVNAEESEDGARPSPDGAGMYEVRCGWKWSFARLLIGAAVLAVVGVLTPERWVSVIWVEVCVVAAAVVLAHIVRRPLALRVNHTGVTLGSTATFGPRRVTAQTAWPRVAAIVLFHRSTSR